MRSIGYIISQYPTVNHTFVLREIRTLREKGLAIRTLSIRGPDRDRSHLTPEEQDEADNTFYLLKSGATEILGAHLKTFITRPMGYFTGLWMALRLAGSDLSQTGSHFIAFAEAVVIGSWAKRKRIDHLHTHFVSNATMLAARMFSISFSMTIHGPDEFNDVEAFHLAEKIHRCQFACAISNFGKSQILRASAWSDWGKVEYCYLGVNPHIFTPREFRRSPKPFRVVSVGRLAAAKGHRVLLDAIKALTEEGRQIELWLAGDGPERQKLEDYADRLGIRASVHFQGALSQPDVLSLYRAADCFALASFAEGIPVVLMEAMAMEIPCVASWVNGIPELIEHEASGLLAAPSDAAGFARQIARLMDDEALQQRLGREGRDRILESFCLDKNAARLAEIFESRLSSGSGSGHG